MKKNILIILSLLLSYVSHASHVPGGNITYECIGPNTYVVTLTLFEDCGTAFTSNGTMSINVANSCGLPFASTVSLQNIIFQQEVSQLCASSMPLSECNGGSLPGVYMHVWQDTITLPGPCNSWTFSYSSCCRNSCNNLSGTSNSYYWESILNSQTAACNSSPVITSQPIPYYCVNQPVVYNFGTYEPDGNTLVYSLIDAMQSATTIVVYNGGYTGATPIPGISINPNTGEITFLPTTTGNYVVAVLIEEFDAAGNLVGSVIQDFQFEIISTAGCTNANPAPPVSGISNFNSSAVQIGPVDIQACEGDNICFDVVFTDANAADSVYLTSNIAQLFPGGTFIQNTFFSPASATICFTVLPGSNPFSTISIEAQDNACPIVGISSMAVGVTVVSSTYAGQNVIMCQGVGTQLQASGGSNFTWSVISGDPINIGTNFSCNNCANPIANPAVTTIYQVISNLAGGCTNIDTVEVAVVPDFSYSLTQSSTSTCINSSIQLNVSPSPSGNYTYSWSPATFLNNSSISNPLVTPTSPGLYDYEMTITSPNGCVKIDTISLNVAAAYAPDITLTASDSNIFCGDTVFMNVDLGGGIPATCGASANTACSSASSQQTLGTMGGSNSSTSWPSPFGNWYKNAKHQFLYTAAELQAAGFIGGKITEISWETLSSNGATTNFMDYTVKMGCTSTSSLSTWESGLTTVYSPQNINVTLGWNTLVLTTAYEWDGISNLVVEICYNNLSSLYTYNWETPQSLTTFNSSLVFYDDNIAACPYVLSPIIGTKRPVTRFTTCPTIPNPNNFSYQWSPPTFLSNSTAQNPYALPMVTTTYAVVVTDLNGGCTDTASVLINVLCDTCMAPIPTLTHVTCFGGSDGSVLAQPTGVDGPPWVVELLDPITSAVLQNDNNVVTSTNFTGLAAGSYIVRSIDTAGCYADTLITLTQPLAVTVSVSSDTVICIGGTATITATGAGGVSPFTYTWTGLAGNSSVQIVNPIISNYYNVIATDSVGCSSSMDSILVALNPPIMINAYVTDTVCPGETASISVTPIGGYILPGSSYTYVWTDQSGNQVGNTALVDVIPSSSPSIYYVVVSDDCSTPAVIDSIEVMWYPEPQVDFISSDNTGCHPVTASFTNTTPSNQVATCLWTFGDGNYSITCGTVSNTYNIPGTYSVNLEVTSPEGCVSDTTILDIVEVYAYPTAMFSATPNPTTVLNPNVNFIDSSSQDVISRSWQFIDVNSSLLGSSSQTNPSFTFPETSPGTYTAILTVINSNGCEDIHHLEVIVNGVFTCYVPNAFTPDGDGTNDYFFVQGESIDPSVFTLSIFDKWGEKIFETDDKDGMWDGTYKNEPAQQEIYIWKIDTKDTITGEHKELTGHVLLMR